MAFEGTPNTEFKIGTGAQPMTGAEMAVYMDQLDAIERQEPPVFEPMFPRTATPERSTVVAESTRGKVVSITAGHISVRSQDAGSGPLFPEAS